MKSTDNNSGGELQTVARIRGLRDSDKETEIRRKDGGERERQIQTVRKTETEAETESLREREVPNPK